MTADTKTQDAHGPPGNARRRLVVFTDLDGTLLNHGDYDYRPALPAIERLRAADIPLVIVTSKTRPEIEALRARLGIRDPFAPENGAAIVWPGQGLRFDDDGTAGAEVIRFGPSYQALRAALQAARAETGLTAQGFGDVSAATVAGWTGLSAADAALAQDRLGSEPIYVGDDPQARRGLREALAAAGIVTTEGGRFVHAIGPFDKGKAMTAMLDRYRKAYRAIWPDAEICSGALGDSPNDLPMLEACDHPVVVPRAHGAPIRPRHDRAFTAAAPGARGFAQGIEHIMGAAFGGQQSPRAMAATGAQSKHARHGRDGRTVSEE